MGAARIHAVTSTLPWFYKVYKLYKVYKVYKLYIKNHGMGAARIHAVTSEECYATQKFSRFNLDRCNPLVEP